MPITSPDPQPFSAERTIPYTSRISADVIVTAPATSKLLCACSSFDSGTRRSERAKVAMPTGTLTKKIHGQER